MAAGTAITPIERPIGGQFHGQFTLDPASVAAGGSGGQTVTVPGVAVGDVAIVVPQLAAVAGVVIGPVTCSANTLTFNIENNSAGAIDLASGTWNYMVFRGSNDRLGG